MLPHKKDGPASSDCSTAAIREREMEGLISAVRGICAGPKHSAPPLIRAALDADVRAMHQLANGVEGLHAATVCGKTPLHWAVARGDPNVLCRLRALGRSYDVPLPLHRVDVRGMTALHYAAVTRNASAMKELLGAGARVDCRDLTGQTPLMKAASWDEKPLCTMLLNKGADVRAADAVGQTALHIAAAGNCEGAARLLAERGAPQAVADAAGRSPLANALRHPPAVQTTRRWAPAAAVPLLPAGNFTPHADETGRSELHWAAANGTQAILWNLLHFAPPSRLRDKEGMTPLMCAIQAHNEDTAKILLDWKSCREEDVDLCGRTALHWAAQCGMSSVVETLLLAGWPTSTLDGEGRDLLMVALCGRDEATALAVLRLAGLQQRADRAGHTALHYAARHAGPGVVLALLRRGADADATDSRRCSPLACVAGRHAAALVDLLACYATTGLLAYQRDTPTGAEMRARLL